MVESLHTGILEAARIRDPKETVRRVYHDLHTIALDQSHVEQKFAVRVRMELRRIELDPTIDHAKLVYALSIISTAGKIIKDQTVLHEGQLPQAMYPIVTGLIKGLATYPLLLPNEYAEMKSLQLGKIETAEARGTEDTKQHKQERSKTDMGPQSMFRELWLTLVGLFIWVGQKIGIDKLHGKLRLKMKKPPEPIK